MKNKSGKEIQAIRMLESKVVYNLYKGPPVRINIGGGVIFSYREGDYTTACGSMSQVYLETNSNLWEEV